MSNDIIFTKIATAGSSPIYNYTHLNEPGFTGEIECTETDLAFDLTRMFSLVRQYLTMAFIMAAEHPAEFDAPSVEQIAKQLLDAQEKRIETILGVLEKKTGQIMIVEALRSNGHIEEGRVVDAYCQPAK